MGSKQPQKNRGGRPKGSKNKRTLVFEKLVAGEADEIVRTMVAKAKAGSTTAAEILLSRVWPVRRDPVVHFDLPPITALNDVLGAFDAILIATSKGQLSPSEASHVAGIVEMRRRAIENVELEARLVALEAKLERHQ